MKSGLDAVKNTLASARRVLIVSHVNPDGDAVGSVAALAHITLHMGHEARIYLQSGVPGNLSWLPIPAPLVRSLGELGGWTPEVLIFADCGDMHRPGEELTAFMKGEIPDLPRQSITTVNIDHHISNPGFADINWVEPGSAATGELVGLLAEHCGLPLTGSLGEALYLALASDTGNFSYSNTGAGCLALAARIVEQGLDVGAFTNDYENNWTLARMHLWGRLMSEVTLYAEGAVACSVAPKRYLDELGLGKDALEGFASWLRKLRGVRVGLFVREDAPSFSKISLRSMGDVELHPVAAQFGGGGHAAAAGAEINLPPDEAAERVLQALLPLL